MLRRVSDEIVHLTHIDDVFWQVQAVIRENNEIKVGGVFQGWIAHCYVDAVTAGLRRLADRRRDVISLWRVFQEMLLISNHVTWDRYLSLHGGVRRHHVERWWVDLVGVSETHVTRALILKKRRQLEAAFEKVCEFANENVAHTAAKPTDVSMTYNEVRDTFVAAFRLYRWCSLVLGSEEMTSPVPTILTNWLEAFRVPWIPRGQRAPKYVRLDDLLEEKGGGSGSAL